MVMIFVLLTLVGKADAKQEALDHIAVAAYKQTGLEDMLNKFVNDRVPAEIRQKFEKVSPIISAIATKRLDLKWNF